MYKSLILGSTYLITFLLASPTIFAQTKVDYTIKGAEGKEVYLAYHFGNKQYIKDTVIIDGKGKGISKFEEKLDLGVYLFVFPNKQWREVLVTGKENLTIEADLEALDISCPGSKENELFFQIQDEMRKFGQQREEVEAKETDEAKQKEALKKIDDAVLAYRENFFSKNNGTMVAALMKAQLEPIIPDEIKGDQQFYYFRKHFFDNIDCSHKWLIRTPIWHSKMHQYLDKLTVQHYDSIIVSVDKLIGLTEQNKDLYQYTVSKIFNKFVNSKAMHAANVYVHIASKYYMNEEKTPWVDEKNRSKMRDRVRKLENNILGSQARNFSYLNETTSRLDFMYTIKSEFLVLLFWDHDCSNCKKVVAAMKPIYEEYKSKGVEVLALNWAGTEEEWRSAVKEKELKWINGRPDKINDVYNDYDVYSTPVIYVLDKKRKVIARRIDPESVKQVLDYELEKDQ